MFYESGAIQRKTPYDHGKRHGIEESFYESGAIQRKTPFINDIIHGIEE